MNSVLKIKAQWERLETGASEERACFAALAIRSGDFFLTEAEDRFARGVRREIPLSAYRLAEWFAWNWWRLRWEPRRAGAEWRMAHRMATIGGGYVWPNIALSSNGEGIELETRPTRSHKAEPVRYLCDNFIVIPALRFEEAVDGFLEQVCTRLRLEKITESNLQRLCDDLREERADPDAARWRRLEALLGFDPDGADPAVVQGLIDDADALGKEAVAELAAARAPDGSVATAKTLREQAAATGFDARPGDAVQLAATVSLPPWGEVAAWRRGAAAARALRQQERLGAKSIANKRLSEMAGVASGALTHTRSTVDFSFALDDATEGKGRVALRARRQTGRRFELARLLGDRIAGGAQECLHPATRGYTYRQQLQRSFAAELLCPLEALEAQLQGDYSDDAIEDAADRFQVSERTVQTLLINHRRVDHDAFGGFAFDD